MSPAATSPARLRAFVESRTAPAPVPLAPELVLHQSSELDELWDAASRQPSARADPPYWAFAWAGGQALARYLLDHPEAVRGRRVVDFATGSGLVAIAAARAGAADVLALDLDPLCQAAVALNAERNQVSVRFRLGDALATALPGCEVLLAGDVFYEPGLAAAALAWFHDLRPRGVRVLAGDAFRTYAPTGGCRQLALYEVPTTTAIENTPVKRARVLHITQ